LNTMPLSMAARCEELIETLVVPRPFDIDRFLKALAEKRGRRIKLIRGRLGPDQPFGMLISTAEIDYIYSADDVPPLQFRHTVMHEVGHLLLGHFTSTSGGGETLRVAGDDALRLLLPTLSPALVRRILARTVYASDEEREAELFASLLLSRVSSVRDAHAGRAPTLHDDLVAPETIVGNPVRQRVWRATRHLTPLWRRVVAEVPQVRLSDVDVGALTSVERAQYRLYRRVLEIRDAQLLLRPYIPPEIPEWAFAAANKRGLDPVAADVLLEAAELDAALDAHRAGQRHHPEVVDVVMPRYPSETPGVLTEACQLIRVGTALHSDPALTALRRR